MTKIIFITDHVYEERGYGGLEVTQRELASRSPKGIKVSFLSVDSLPIAPSADPTPTEVTEAASKVAKADLIVFTNIVRWPRWTIKELAARRPYVKMEFDYNFCKTRLKNCEDGCASCVEDGWYQDFLQGAERIFFTCPAQKDAYRRILGTVADNSILNPSWIDPEKFPDLKWERTPGTGMYHGRLFQHKGVANAALYAAANDLQFTFVGDGPPEIEHFLERLGCRVLRRVTPQLIPYLLNATERWVMLSDWDDTGPMSAIEAYLCGANVVHNQRLGYFSYPWDWSKPEAVREELKQIAPRFWGEITRILEEI